MSNVNDLAPLSRRIKDVTHPVHESLDRAIMTRHLFHSAEGYRTFAVMNYLFHRDLNGLYQNSELMALVPDLGVRSRFHHLRQDLEDLRVPLPYSTVDPVPAEVSSAMGWLYVAEGSKLGANFLSKLTEKLGFTSQFGARHLAADPAGRGQSWNTFRDALDTADLDAGRVIAGAQAGFTRVRHYLNTLTQHTHAPC
ncbi:MAG: biliverdin-producing heme oxygenase [Acetobacter sp.]|uniref:biliverdin-producing heme oxygenase n=1 Tax=Acetobacter sp. TaxID=440 RepID=UPI0039EAF5A2